jgi:hypothetical protein
MPHITPEMTLDPRGNGDPVAIQKAYDEKMIAALADLRLIAVNHVGESTVAEGFFAVSEGRTITQQEAQSRMAEAAPNIGRVALMISPDQQLQNAA